MSARTKEDYQPSFSATMVWTVKLDTLWLLSRPSILPDLHYSFEIWETGPVKGQHEGLGFACTGFSNWKDATISYNSHKASLTPKRAVEVVTTLPQTTSDVGELLLTAHATWEIQESAVLDHYCWEHSFSCKAGDCFAGRWQKGDWQ